MAAGDNPDAVPVSRQLIGAVSERDEIAYRDGLAKLVGRRGGFTQKQVDDFAAGFQDGQRSMVAALVAAGIIRVTEV